MVNWESQTININSFRKNSFDWLARCAGRRKRTRVPSRRQYRVWNIQRGGNTGMEPCSHVCSFALSIPRQSNERVAWWAIRIFFTLACYIDYINFLKNRDCAICNVELIALSCVSSLVYLLRQTVNLDGLTVAIPTALIYSAIQLGSRW